MKIILLLVCMVGFALWAFLQKGFVGNTNSNVVNGKEVIFPIIVPFLASLIVLFYYIVIYSKLDLSFATTIFKDSISERKNLVLLGLSSLGLAVGYIIYPNLIKFDPKHAIFYLILSTAFIALLFLCYKWSDSYPIFNRLPRPYEVFGLALALAGIIVLKYGDKFFYK